MIYLRMVYCLFKSKNFSLNADITTLNLEKVMKIVISIYAVPE